MSYSAKIVLDSVGPNGARVTTFELEYPRFVHAELMTHRVFSRNSASSRAIPTEKLLQRVENDPVIPRWWGKNVSGMQAPEELETRGKAGAMEEWLVARQDSVRHARNLGEIGLHKQIANRVVEPWMFIVVLVTATELDNFFALRCHKDAQPELRAVADHASDLYAKSKPQKLFSGEWHLPLVTGNDEDALSREYDEKHRLLISAGRCARVSYLTHDGKRDPEADVALAAERIRPGGHMSPFEHQAQAMTSEEWSEYGEELMEEWVRHRIPPGNLWGFRQHRKTMLHEHNFALLKPDA